MHRRERLQPDTATCGTSVEHVDRNYLRAQLAHRRSSDAFIRRRSELPDRNRVADPEFHRNNREIPQDT